MKSAVTYKVACFNNKTPLQMDSYTTGRKMKAPGALFVPARDHVK
jgi:hypothetical protein